MSGRVREGTSEPTRLGAARLTGLEWLGLLVLAGLAAYFLHVSWRKWPDPLTDFGRELYIPWRMSEGAVLQRDVEDFYGPLSQYFNALLFRVFGPGLMVLVTANLVVYAAILGFLYALLRRAFGAGGAWTGAAVFVSVFSFAQYVGIGNYNYATPYVHATTHGMLVVLALSYVLVGWVEQVSVRASVLAGFLLGLTAVLKPEFMLSGAVVSLAAVALRARSNGWPPARAMLAWGIGLVLPTLAFWLEFARHLPWSDAFLAGGRAWVTVVTTSKYSRDASQLEFLGFTRPGENLASHAVSLAWAVAILTVLFAAARLVDRSKYAAVRVLVCGSLVVGLAWGASAWIEWFHVGRALLGLSLAYCAWSILDGYRGRESGGTRLASVARVLLAVLAVTMMARMALNGRIYHFGFYQAAAAGALLPAVMIGELPVRFATTRMARGLVVVGGLALLVPGVARLAQRSELSYRIKTHPVGKGVDRFYAYPPNLDPTGAMIDSVSTALTKQPAGRSVLVLPAGAMINYLSRRPIPIPQTVFFAGTLADGGEERVVEQLKRSPPRYVVLISHDLREFGVRRYGEAVGKGASIMSWVDRRYVTITSLGNDPLDSLQRGLRVLEAKKGD